VTAPLRAQAPRTAPVAAPAIDDLREAAVRVLSANWTGTHSVPSRTLYPHQWSWDSAFIAIGLAGWAPERARRELLTLFDAQWADGRVPHIVFSPSVPEDAYFPGPAFWRSHQAPAAPQVATSGIVQPPVHALAAWRVHQLAPDRAFLREIYPRLVAQQEYLRTHRRPAGDGLVAIVHPWESGMDNSPAWDEPLAAVPAEPLRERRRDIAHVAPEERPTDLDYQRYVALAVAYRDGGYRDDRLLDEHAFVVADPLFNAAYGAAEAALADIAAEIGGDPCPHLEEAEAVTRAMVERLFDPARNLFLARDLLTGKALAADSIAGLTPLILPDLPGDIADRLIDTAVTRFGLYAGLPPSYAPGGPAFERARYWRGPAWVNTAWLLWHGLRQRRAELATLVAESIIQVTAASGFREYFDPFTWEGHGCHDFGWSAALTLDVLDAR
jgi:glycogen debranching enzyme